jgi:uncharacterized RmlC-like cupin family protein
MGPDGGRPAKSEDRRAGDRLEFVAEAGPGDFIYVPPYVPHQEINADDDLPLSCVLVRSGAGPLSRPRRTEPRLVVSIT